MNRARRELEERDGDIGRTLQADQDLRPGRIHSGEGQMNSGKLGRVRLALLNHERGDDGKRNKIQGTTDTLRKTVRAVLHDLEEKHAGPRG